MKDKYNQILLYKPQAGFKSVTEFDIVTDTYFDLKDIIDDISKLKEYLINLYLTKNTNDILIKYDVFSSKEELCVIGSFIFALEDLLQKLELPNKLQYHGKEELSKQHNKILKTDIIQCIEIPFKEAVLY